MKEDSPGEFGQENANAVVRSVMRAAERELDQPLLKPLWRGPLRRRREPVGTFDGRIYEMRKFIFRTPPETKLASRSDAFLEEAADFLMPRASLS